MGFCARVGEWCDPHAAQLRPKGHLIYPRQRYEIGRALGPTMVTQDKDILPGNAEITKNKYQIAISDFLNLVNLGTVGRKASHFA